ncbi:MAG: monofunctional biosynthetic peptidoglycan transglycosylase [Burkholderiales bacterium]
MLKTLWRWSWRAFLLGLIALTAVQFWFLVHVWYWEGNNPESTAFMRARLEILQEDNPKARLRQQWVPYQRISGHLKRAIIAAEDAKFVSHNGFDWDGIQKAYEKNMREGEIVAGGSTITQQLAKNLFFSGERTWWRKAQEAVVAVMIETVMSKRRILEIYLNVIEWGEGVFGAEAAARLHYGTTAAGLSAEQAARLASIVPSPRRYGPASDTAYLQRRTQTILARMNGSQIP